MSAPAIASPCTGICKLDEATGWCQGCARTGDEIATWRANPEPWREAVWAEIPFRLKELGVACRRLPWTTEAIRDWVAASLTSGEGTWVMGVMGGVAEFTAPPGASVSTSIQDTTLTATTEGGAIRITIDDDIRALTFDPGDTPNDKLRVVLAVKRSRGLKDTAQTITDLGRDPSPIIPDNAQHLVDLGLGMPEARFCVRLQPGDAYDALKAQTGRPLMDALPAIGPQLLAASPTRIVETPLGRIEVTSPIPAATGASPLGPHTHLLPEHLATKRALPVGMDLPKVYVPAAMYYPPQG